MSRVTRHLATSFIVLVLTILHAAAGAVAAAATGKADLKTQAKRILAAYGHGAAQFDCFDKIVHHESGWNHRAVNASSGAYGLVQALPASKIASAGADWRTNPATQIRWGLSYMTSRYGSPCKAWAFWQTHRWY